MLISIRLQLTVLGALLLTCTEVWANCAVAGANETGRLAITGMPLLQPAQSRVGEISGMEVRLPQLLVVAMNREGRQLALDYSHLDLRSLMRPQGYYSSHMDRSKLSLQRVELPDAEFLLTGLVENVGLASDKTTSFFGRYLDRTLALMDRRYNQPRQLSLIIELYEADTGNLLLQRRYTSQANWDLSKRRSTGLDDPRVWQAAYGREMERVVEEVAADVRQAMPCTGSGEVEPGI